MCFLVRHSVHVRDIILVDETLSVLTSAAQSRGLSHELTRNLASLAGTHLNIHHNVNVMRGTWDNRVYPPSAPSAQRVPEPGSKTYNKIIQRKEWKKVSDSALGAFSEVVKIAEAQQGLILGRVKPR